MPRWVQAFLIAGAVLLAIVLTAAVSGGHGPGRHGTDEPPTTRQPAGAEN